MDPAKLGAAKTLIMSAKADPKHVEKDANGTITAFRVLPLGKHTLTRPGEKLALNVSGEFVDKVVAAHAAKGVKIPIDCEHTAFFAAQKAGISESELVAVTGNKMLAMGYCSLAKRADGLWAEGVEWNEPGKAIAASGIMRYHSPVMHIGDDLVTSVSMTKLPFLDKLDAIACAVDEEGTSEIAEGGENKQNADGSLRARLAKMLELGEDIDDTAIITALEAILANLAEMKTQVETVAASATNLQNEKRETIIAAALADGRISNATAAEFCSLDCDVVERIVSKLVPSQGVKLKVISASAAPAPETKSRELDDNQLRILRASGATEDQINRIKAGE